MPTETAQAAQALDDGRALTLAELAELSGLPESVVRELVDYGAFTPADAQGPTWTFSSHCVVIARRAHHLRDDFDLDSHAVSVLLGFVERIEQLEAELRNVRAQVPGFR